MRFAVIGEITDIETIAVGSSIREIVRLQQVCGAGRWRKLKSVTMVRLADGMICKAEIHWDEAHGIGKKETKLSRIVAE